MKWKSAKRIVKSLFTLLIVSVLLGVIAGCGGSGGSTPVSIPAPTGGYITASAPGPDTKSLVFGYIIANGTALPGVTVQITNTRTLDTATTTTDADAFFAEQIDPVLGDTIEVKYLDPTYSSYSEGTSVTVENDTHPMSTPNMVPYDISLASGGVAYVVGNDGTNSEIDALDLVNKTITNRAVFSNATFDKIAAHSGIDYIAVLDTAGDMLYWYDTTNLTDDVAADSEFSVTDPTDLTIADLSATATIADQVVVSVQSTTQSIRFYTIDPNAHTLTSTGSFCFAHPDDAAGTSIAACNAAFATQPTQTTTVRAMVTTTDAARVALITDYDDGSVAHHWGFLTSTAPPTITVATDATSLARSYSVTFAAGIDPNRLAWYDQSITLITDSTNNNLEMYEEECAATCSLDTDEIAGGTASQEMFGLATDITNRRAFVSDRAGDNILGVDMNNNFALSGTTYTALVGPTDMVYYGTGDGSELLGIVLPRSKVMRIISVSP